MKNKLFLFGFFAIISINSWGFDLKRVQRNFPNHNVREINRGEAWSYMDPQPSRNCESAYNNNWEFRAYIISRHGHGELWLKSSPNHLVGPCGQMMMLR